jgi:hypothetical protein
VTDDAEASSSDPWCKRQDVRDVKDEIQLKRGNQGYRIGSYKACRASRDGRGNSWSQEVEVEGGEWYFIGNKKTRIKWHRKEVKKKENGE